MSSTKQIDPFHAGEIYHLWTYLLNTKEYLVVVQVFRNHTEDSDLQNILDDLTENSLVDEEQQVETILKEAGIRLPAAPPNRPNVESQDIPAGARFHEPEIVSFVQKELLVSKFYCSYLMSVLVDETFRTLFADFHAQKEEYDSKLNDLKKTKGWAQSPPVHIK